MIGMNPTTLFAALGGIPRLPGAACRGRWELFDSPDATDIAAAIQTCSSCPARYRCAEWVASLSPKQRPAGVVAGQIHIPITPEQTRRRGKAPAA